MKKINTAKKNTVKKNSKPVAKKPVAKKETKKPVAKKPTAKKEVKKTIEAKPVEVKPIETKPVESAPDREKTNAYAREYYRNHREARLAASRRCIEKKHRAAETLAGIYDAVCGLVSEQGEDAFDRFYSEGGEAMMDAFRNACLTLGCKIEA